jgi:hypothetical protein
MKRLLILSAFCFLMADPDPVGNWKLSGLKVDYIHITREAATVALSDAYGFGITVPVSEIPEGIVFQRFTNGPFTLPIIDAAQLNLNVNIYPDGTGAIAEGSFYPDIDLIEGTCITSPQIFPVTDTFNWEAGDASAFSTTNIIGIPGLNDLAGTAAVGFGVNASSTFDAFPATAVPEALPEGLEYVALSDGTILAASCGATCVGGLADLYFGGDVATCVGACSADPATYGAGYFGGSGASGFFQTEDLGNSQMGQDLGVDFLLEWNGIDGPNTGSGYGDDPDVDENGDGSAFDRVFGLPYIPATYTTADCSLAPGLDLPIAGDLTGLVAGLVGGLCVEAGGAAEFVYGSCLAQVQDGVEDQCDSTDLDGDGAGSPVEAVTGLCYDASQSDDFAGACAYYGAATALVVTCQQLGFDDETCAAAGEQGVGGVEAYCQYLSGGYTCEQAGIDQCTVLTDPTFAFGLCGTLAGSLTESETCDEWAASFEDDWLNDTATQVLGMTCSDYASYATGGLEVGSFNTDACAVVGQGAEDGCISAIDFANDMYLMDLSLETWGYFLTYNAASVQQYQAYGYSLEAIAYSFPELFVDDSAGVFDPACYATGYPVGCGGKLVMSYEPQCINELEARQIVAEFVDLDDLCEASGDVNGDGTTNVVDVVRMVTHVLGGDQLGGVGGCEADVNGDGAINVVDIVVVVNSILSSRSAQTNATEATVLLADNSISIDADGYIGGIDMVVEFSGSNLSLDLGAADVAEYIVNDDNTARIIMASVESINDIATVNSGRITAIRDIEVVTSDENSYVPMDDSNIDYSGTPDAFSVGAAYPNPFNPSTNLSLELNTTADISVKVFNVAGQLVDVIAEGTYSPNTYNWTWDAENLASGVYLVRTQVGNNVDSQKIMLLK